MHHNVLLGKKRGGGPMLALESYKQEAGKMGTGIVHLISFPDLAGGRRSGQIRFVPRDCLSGMWQASQ